MFGSLTSIRSALTNDFGVVEAELRGDPKSLLIQALQGGRVVQTIFDFAAFCVNRQVRRAAPNTETDLSVTVPGNPALAET